MGPEIITKLRGFSNELVAGGTSPDATIIRLMREAADELEKLAEKAWRYDDLNK